MICTRVLDTELIVCVHSTINHLRIVVVSLCLYLMTYVLLENIIWLIGHLPRVLDGGHHVGTSGQMWIITAFK